VCMCMCTLCVCEAVCVCTLCVRWCVCASVHCLCMCMCTLCVCAMVCVYIVCVRWCVCAHCVCVRWCVCVPLPTLVTKDVASSNVGAYHPSDISTSPRHFPIKNICWGAQWTLLGSMCTIECPCWLRDLAHQPDMHERHTRAGYALGAPFGVLFVSSLKRGWPDAHSLCSRQAVVASDRQAVVASDRQAVVASDRQAVVASGSRQAGAPDRQAVASGSRQAVAVAEKRKRKRMR